MKSPLGLHGTKVQNSLAVKILVQLRALEP